MLELPFASETLQTSGAKNAAGQSLNFPVRVWFPGEWEEVKAIVLTARFLFLGKWGNRSGGC